MALKPLIAGNLYQASSLEPLLAGLTRAGGVFRPVIGGGFYVSGTSVAVPVPVNTVAPALDDTSPGVGDTINCSTGTWTNTPTSYTYQWYRTPAAFVPTDIAGLELWLQYNQLALADNDPISLCPDDSGNSNDASASGAERFIFKTNVINGGAVGRSDGVDDKMVTVNSLTQPRTIIWMGQVKALPGNRTLVGSIGGGNVLLYVNSSGNLSVYAGSSVTTSGTVSVDTPFIVVGIFNGASSSVQINNQTAATGDPGSSGSGGVVFQIANDPFNEFVNADHMQVLIYDGVISGTDLTNLKNYLAAIGGITL